MTVEVITTLQSRFFWSLDPWKFSPFALALLSFCQPQILYKQKKRKDCRHVTDQCASGNPWLGKNIEQHLKTSFVSDHNVFLCWWNKLSVELLFCNPASGLVFALISLMGMF